MTSGGVEAQKDLKVLRASEKSELKTSRDPMFGKGKSYWKVWEGMYFPGGVVDDS